MYYLVCNHNCQLNDLGAEENVKINANTPYQIDGILNMPCVLSAAGCKAVDINFYDAFNNFATNPGWCLAKHGGNKYLFVWFSPCADTDVRMFEFLKSQVLIFLSDKLIVNFNNEQVVNVKVSGIKFSHYEISSGFCFVFFEGARQFVLVLNKNGLVWADFYDEYNESTDEKQFLKHLCDGLNHGRVLSLKKEDDEKYLVYLDDFEMNLKPEFVGLVFMDCLIAGNLKYCKNLLSKSFNIEDENTIKTFFPEFDSFYPFSATSVALFKKNALAGICDFEIEEDKIVNIVIH